MSEVLKYRPCITYYDQSFKRCGIKKSRCGVVMCVECGWAIDTDKIDIE